MGLSQGQVKPKTIKLVFVASLLIMQHEGKSKDFVRFSVCSKSDLIFYATFSSISAISWQPALVVEEAGVP
jgi:hypothetical protein